MVDSTPESKRYNGWTNYETWNVALWLGNDQGSDGYWREAAQECLDDTDADNDLTQRREDAASPLAARLKDEVEDGNPLAGQNGMYCDLLSAAISEVNWYEIAENWLDDVEPTD